MNEIILFSKEFAIPHYPKVKRAIYISAFKGYPSHILRKREFFTKYFCEEFYPFNYTQSDIDKSDMIVFGGGDTFSFLAIRDMFEWPDNKVYVGISAGSVFLGKNIGFSSLFDDNEDAVPLTYEDTEGLGKVNCIIKPHAERLRNQVQQRMFQNCCDNINETFYTNEHAQPLAIADNECYIYSGTKYTYFVLREDGVYGKYEVRR